MKQSINVFLRQPFTQTSQKEQEIISSAFDTIKLLEIDNLNFNFVTGDCALNKDNFIQEWEKITNANFTPDKFRKYRIELINRSNLFIYVRTSMSESSAFEISYNVYNRKIPMFFAVWDKAPLKTTLLRDLESMCPVKYYVFSNPHDIKEPLATFIKENFNN